MRVMATACARENREVPVAHAVIVGTDTVWFLLKTPDERPPAGWTADHDARAWYAQLRWVQTAEVTESLPEPYPQLVSIGNISNGFALLNLGKSGGIIALEGDSRRARGLVQDWTRELTTNPWSRGVQVVRVGFKPGTADPIGTTEVQNLADAASALAQPTGGVLILASMPGGRDRERVHYLADHPKTPWSVVVLGRGDRPRWRFTIDSRGLIDTRLLPEPVHHPLNPALNTPPLADDVKDVTVTPAPRPAAGSVGRPGQEKPDPNPPSTRRRTTIIVSAVAAACVVAAVLVLTLGGGLFGPSASTSAGPASSGPGQTTVPTSPATSNAPTAPDSPASPNPPAPPNADGSPLLNTATNTCLSAGAGTDGTPLTLAPCGSDANQQWKVSEDGTIRSKGLCMDGAAGATTTGTTVQVANCSGNPAQQFSLRDGTVYSTQANKCLKNVNGRVQLYPCGKDGAETFQRK
ncbi:RICIN domain-containing protein [Streptomyces pinistramenti]|uniref:RICIN domain-containing protein n=1 Tax=Streptomyces pinistramenti TaxID=2884812 RepID=UPI001D068D0A|nr:RICIN domain-containing protein [Streptomyces pinistramenti]MCB5907530.1 ricin-type beta-trefoil lectin domain protein [Streptomyces pinistramenti]